MFFIRNRKSIQDQLDFHQLQENILQNILLNIRILKKKYNKNLAKELLNDLKALRDNTEYLPYQAYEITKQYEDILSTELDKLIDLDELIYETEFNILYLESSSKAFWFKIQNKIWSVSIILMFSAPILIFIFM